MATHTRSSASAAVVVHPEVGEALGAAGPVVALETAVVTHGLPRGPLGFRPPGADAAFDPQGDGNLETARLLERRVREAGAVPATIAVIDGVLRIGLDDVELERLARDPGALKASTRELPLAMHAEASAGLTVAAVLHACGLATPAPISVFATGGIGGVHRGFAATLDISTDLRQLALSNVCVVCSGGKSMLDLRATAEALESLGVGVYGYQTDLLPRFTARRDGSLRAPARFDDERSAARVCRIRWQELHLAGAVIVANPLDDALALEESVLLAANAEAHRRADEAGATGPSLTPFILGAMAELTDGRSLAANLALLTQNAALAGRIAVAMADDRRSG